MIRGRWFESVEVLSILPVSIADNSIQLDADDMFFHSISAVVKDLPKLSKTALKLEILTLVNTTMQNEEKKREQATTAGNV